MRFEIPVSWCVAEIEPVLAIGQLGQKSVLKDFENMIKKYETESNVT